MTTAGVVGRDAELDRLRAFLAAARDRFSVVSLEGEPGIGKTALWRAAVREARAAGMRVLACRPSAAEAKLSWTGVADLLDEVGGPDLDRLPEPQREALEVALLRAPVRAEGGRVLARGVAAALLTLLRALTADAPLLLAIDDWQWLDGPSRRALQFAARRLDSEPIGLLSSLRLPSDEPPPDQWLDDSRVERLQLSGLSAPALARIAADRLGRPLGRSSLTRLRRVSGGNPLHALELVRLLDGHRDGAAGAELPVPEDLRALTEARVRALSPAVRDALLLAAVLSEPDASSPGLNGLSAQDSDGIVLVGAGGRIEFAHPLFAAAAYASLSPAERRRLHRRAAETVSDPERHARHLALATSSPDSAVAAKLDHAAQLASVRGAPDAAAELSELAADRTAPGAPDARAARLVRAAALHLEAGDLERSEAALAAALSLDGERVTRARALQLAGQLCGRRSNFGAAREQALAALALAGDDAALCASIECDLAFCAVSLGELPAAQPHARAAVRAAGSAADRGLEAGALAVAAMIEFLLGGGVAQDDVERALAQEDPARDDAFVMRPSFIAALLLLWTGELDGALQRLRALHAESVARGQDGVAPMLFLYLAWALCWRGELREAGELAVRAVETVQLVGEPAASATALAAAALVHAYDGRADAARDEAGRALELFGRLGWRSGTIWPLWALGLSALAEGEPAQVDRALGPLADALGAAGALGQGDPVLSMFVPDEVEALIALGRAEEAEELLAGFERGALRLGRDWAIAAAARCRGLLASAAGRPDEAADAFAGALAAHDRCPMPVERARTLLAAGRASRRAKRRRQAGEQLQQALELFERAGAPAWAAAARAELARLGHRSVDRDELSEAERTIAALAALGLSNREAAERAFVSVKTVEAALTRVYRKLGVRSRVELAIALRDDADPRA